MNTLHSNFELVISMNSLCIIDTYIYIHTHTYIFKEEKLLQRIKAQRYQNPLFIGLLKW